MSSPPPTRAQVGDDGLRAFAVIIGLTIWVWLFPWVRAFSTTGALVVVGSSLLVFIGLAIRRFMEVRRDG